MDADARGPTRRHADPPGDPERAARTARPVLPRGCGTQPQR
jgi:hypothetical protein